MKLLNKIKYNKITIGVIGLGYVGLPLLKGFASQNLKIIGFDVDKKKIIKLKNRISYIKHIQLDSIRKNKKIIFTSDFQKISNVDLIILCLPTPLTKNKLPDLSFIKKTMLSIEKYLKSGCLIAIDDTPKDYSMFSNLTESSTKIYQERRKKLGENYTPGKGAKIILNLEIFNDFKIIYHEYSLVLQKV